MKLHNFKVLLLDYDAEQHNTSADCFKNGMLLQLIAVKHSPRLFLISQCNSLQRIKIDFDQIIRLEADGMECMIWLPNNICYTTTKPMTAVLNRLPAEIFKKCHRSHVINVNYVVAVQHNEVQLEHTKKPIPIGDRKIHVAFDLWDKANSL